MARFQIQGARRESGEELRLEVEAADALQAEMLANGMGVLVQTVEPVGAEGRTFRMWKRLKNRPFWQVSLALIAGLVLFVLSAASQERHQRRELESFLEAQRRIAAHWRGW